MKLENGTLCHDLLAEKMQPKLSFNEKDDFNQWESNIREKFIELLGLDEIEKNG